MQRTLMRARAISAEVAAEQARRGLNEDLGKYLVADQAAAAWTRTLTEIVRGIDQELGALDLLLGLDDDQALALRQWWGDCRERLASQLTAEASSLDEFVEEA